MSRYASSISTKLEQNISIQNQRVKICMGYWIKPVITLHTVEILVIHHTLTVLEDSDPGMRLHSQKHQPEP